MKFNLFKRRYTERSPRLKVRGTSNLHSLFVEQTDPPGFYDLVYVRSLEEPQPSRNYVSIESRLRDKESPDLCRISVSCRGNDHSDVISARNRRRSIVKADARDVKRQMAI